MAEEIATKTGLEARRVRLDFIGVIEERVKAIEAKGMIIGKNYGRRDDWLLALDSLHNVFKSVSEILHHHTGYTGYQQIPLEIVVGTLEFDKWAKFEEEKLIVEPAVIEFVKMHLTERYREYYKNKNKEPIRSTFVVLTESAYRALDRLDRRMCEPIEYKADKEHKKFFVADVGRVKQKGQTLGKRKPELHIGEPEIVREFPDSPHSMHLRIPVTAKNGNFKEVEAKIVSITPSTSYIRGGKVLFWKGAWKRHHNDRAVTRTAQQREDHLRYKHFSCAAPVNINEYDTKSVNVLVRIEGKDGCFLGNDLLDFTGASTEYEIGILFSAPDVSSCLKTIKVHIGSTYDDIKVISFS